MANELDKILIKYDQPDFKERLNRNSKQPFSGLPTIDSEKEGQLDVILR